MRSEIELQLPALHHKAAAEDFKNVFFEMQEQVICGSALFDQMEYEPWLMPCFKYSFLSFVPSNVFFIIFASNL